jgi:hypothetical protein
MPKVKGRLTGNLLAAHNAQRRSSTPLSKIFHRLLAMTQVNFPDAAFRTLQDDESAGKTVSIELWREMGQHHRQERAQAPPLACLIAAVLLVTATLRALLDLALRGIHDSIVHTKFSA